MLVCACSVSCFTCLAVPKRARLGRMPSPSAPRLKVRWSPLTARLSKVRKKSNQIKRKWHLQTSSVTNTVCVSHALISAAFITMLLQGSAVGVWISLKWTGYRNWSPIECDLTVNSHSVELMSYSTCIVLLTHIWLHFRHHNCF